MTKFRFSSIFIFIIILCILLFPLIPFIQAGSLKTIYKRPCRINRRIDPIIIQASELKGVKKHKIADLRLMAWRKGKWHAVPFQMDKKDKKGKYILDHKRKKKGWGIYAGSHRENLYEKDELAFIACDLGGKAPSRAPFFKKIKARIEVTRPDSRKKGYLYIFSSQECSFKKSDDKYIRSNPDNIMITTSDYCFEFKNPNRPGFLNLVAFNKKIDEISPDKAYKYSVQDRVRFDLYLSFILKELKFHWDEKKLIVKTAAYKEGPVRVIQRIWARLDLVLGLKSPRIFADVISTPGRLEVRSLADIPFKPILSLINFDVSFEYDFKKYFSPGEIYNPKYPEILKVDGYMDESEHRMLNRKYKLGKQKPIWTAAISSHGGSLVRVFPSKKLRDDYKKVLKRLNMKFLYDDDANNPDPRGGEAGYYGKTGIKFSGKADMFHGKYNMKTIIYFQPDMKRRDIPRLLDIDDKPLKVEVFKQ